MDFRLRSTFDTDFTGGDFNLDEKMMKQWKFPFYFYFTPLDAHATSSLPKIIDMLQIWGYEKKYTNMDYEIL